MPSALQRVDQVAGRVCGIDNDAVTGLPVADQVGEIAHLLGDAVAPGEVSAGEQLAEVQLVLVVTVRHPLSLMPATGGERHRFGALAAQAVPSFRPEITTGAAPLAQSVERFHGKEKVNGSIPLGGSATPSRQAARTKTVQFRGGVAQSVRANDS